MRGRINNEWDVTFIIMRTLLKVELIALVALCLASIAVGFLAFGQAHLISNNIFTPLETAIVTGGHAALWGFLPTVIYGAPIYLLLRLRHLDRWINVLAVGILPGMVILLISIPVGLYAIFAGAAVSSLTHFLSNKGSRWLDH